MKERMQTVYMLIKTYVNLYGRQPTVGELSQQLDASYLQLIEMVLRAA